MNLKTISSFALAFFFFTFSIFLAGCGGTKETTTEEDDFFVPVDTAQQRPENKFNNAMQPGAVEIQEGAQQQGGDEFGAPLSGSDIVFREHLTSDAMRDSLDLIAGQVAYLQNILEASTIDPRMYYHSQVKSWTINNPALRDSLFYALLAVDSSVQTEAGSDAQILATESNDLIEARFGTSVFKGLTLTQALDKSGDRFLAQKILESAGYSKDVELRDTNFTIPTALDPELMPFALLSNKFLESPPVHLGNGEVSLYGMNFRIGPNWGAAIKIGNDEIGLPFWTSGDLAFFATYKQLKVGFQLPVGLGRTSGDQFPLFPIRNRLLTGTRGIVAEADFGPAGGHFFSSRLTSADAPTIPDIKDYFYITGELVAYYSFGFSLNNQNFIRAKVGGGMDQVSEGTANPPVPGGALVQLQTTTFGNLYMSIDYLHDVPSERFGAGIQFYDYSILTTAWLDIIPRSLRIELKYAKIISRTERPWETPDFVIVSPKYLFAF